MWSSLAAVLSLGGHADSLRDKALAYILQGTVSKFLIVEDKDLLDSFKVQLSEGSLTIRKAQLNAAFVNKLLARPSLRHAAGGDHLHAEGLVVKSASAELVKITVAIASIFGGDGETAIDIDGVSLILGEEEAVFFDAIDPLYDLHAPDDPAAEASLEQRLALELELDRLVPALGGAPVQPAAPPRVPDEKGGAIGSILAAFISTTLWSISDVTVLVEGSDDGPKAETLKLSLGHVLISMAIGTPEEPSAGAPPQESLVVDIAITKGYAVAIASESVGEQSILLCKQGAIDISLSTGKGQPATARCTACSSAAAPLALSLGYPLCMETIPRLLKLFPHRPSASAKDISQEPLLGAEAHFELVIAGELLASWDDPAARAIVSDLHLRAGSGHFSLVIGRVHVLDLHDGTPVPIATVEGLSITRGGALPGEAAHIHCAHVHTRVPSDAFLARSAILSERLAQHRTGRPSKEPFGEGGGEDVLVLTVPSLAVDMLLDREKGLVLRTKAVNARAAMAGSLRRATLSVDSLGASLADDDEYRAIVVVALTAVATWETADERKDADASKGSPSDVAFERTLLMVEGSPFVRIRQDGARMKEEVLATSKAGLCIAIAADRLSTRCKLELLAGLHRKVATAPSRRPKAKPSVSVMISIDLAGGCSVDLYDLGVSLDVASLAALAAMPSHGSEGTGLPDLLDLRMDPLSIAIQSKGGRGCFQKKVVTPSLDASFRPLIVTMARRAREGTVGMGNVQGSYICSALLCGSLITMPEASVLAELMQRVAVHLPGGEPFAAGKQPPSTEDSPAPTLAPIVDCYLSLNMCSIANDLPSAFKRICPPHSLYCRDIRVVARDVLHKRDATMYIQQAEAFLAPTLASTSRAGGLFSEGHNYWIEQNYRPVGKADFIQASILFPSTTSRATGGPAAGSDAVVVVVENNLVVVDLHKDALHLIKVIAKVYNVLLRRRPGSSSRLQKEPPQSLAKGDGLADEHREVQAVIAADDLVGEAAFTLDPQSYEEKAKAEGGDESIRISLMATSPHSHEEEECIVRITNAAKDLSIQEDYLEAAAQEADAKQPLDEASSFDSIDGAPILLRLKVIDVSIKVRLLEGTVWLADRDGRTMARQHLPTVPEALAFSSSTDPRDILPHDPAMPPSYQSQSDGGLLGTSPSSSFCSKWSMYTMPQRPKDLHSSSTDSTIPRQSTDGAIRGTFKSKLNRPIDHIDICIDRLNAELHWTNPFPSPEEAEHASDGPLGEPIRSRSPWPPVPSSALTFARATIKRIAIEDFVRASKWSTILARSVSAPVRDSPPAASSHHPMLSVTAKSYFVARSKMRGGSSPPLQAEAAPLEEQLECTLDIAMDPLRLYIDQDALMLFLSFLDEKQGSEACNRGQRASSPSGPSTCHDHDGGELLDMPLEPVFIQKLHLSPLSVRLDYKPKRLDVADLFGGQYVQLLNVFSLEDASIALPSTTLFGVSSMDNLVDGLARNWMPHLRQTQVPAMANGVSTIRTISNVSGGISDLILLPIEAYQHDGQLLKGLRLGGASFFHSTIAESMRVVAGVAATTQVILEHADDLFTGSSLAPPSAAEGHRATGRDDAGLDPCSHDALYGDRAAGLKKDSKWMSVNPPSTARKGLYDAYESITSSLIESTQTIIAVPIRVYEESGPEGAIKAVLRAVPVAVLRPMIGISGGLRSVLTGMHNSIDAVRKEEARTKFKGSHRNSNHLGMPDSNAPQPSVE